MSLPHPRRILIVGGGPIGLVTLRNFLDRGDYDDVQLVERRDDVGGVWYLDTPSNSADGRTRWPSPAYPGLMGNVLPKFLSFSGAPFPPPSTFPDQPFPDLLQTYQYLKNFAKPLLETGRVRLNTEVVTVEEQADGKGWKVDLKHHSPEGVQESAETWDAVIVATAWYDNPNWPDTPGLDEARAKGIAKHAKDWDGPVGFEGQRVVVVGNANSANDISSQLAPVAAAPGVYRSIRRPNMIWFPMLEHPRMVDVAPIAKYSFSSPSSTSCTVHLEDGTQIDDVAHVFLGTGYAPLAPLVRVLSASGSLVPLTDSTVVPRRVPQLHRHIIYAPNPTLAFVGGVVAAIPFTLGDLSSTWLALAWSPSSGITYPDTVEGRLESEKVRLEAVETLRKTIENPTSLIAYHVLGPEELPYARGLREEVVRVRPELENELIEWSDTMWEEKEGMFGTKAEVLKRQSQQINA